MPEGADKPYRDMCLQPPTQELSTDEVALLIDKARIITTDDVPQGTGAGIRRLSSRQHAERNTWLNESNVLGLILRCMEQSPDPRPFLSENSTALSPKDLSEEQIQWLRYKAQGLSNPEIGQELFLTASAVRQRGTVILKALDIPSVKSALELCFQTGVLNPTELTTQDELLLALSKSGYRRILDSLLEASNGTRKAAAQATASTRHEDESISENTFSNAQQRIFDAFRFQGFHVNSTRLWVIAYAAREMGLLETTANDTQ